MEKVVLNNRNVRRLYSFVSKVIDAKRKENRFQKDWGKMQVRFFTGFGAELALEQYLGVDFVDLSVGHSNTYSVADLGKLGLDCGVKSARNGGFPLIAKRPTRPEILVDRVAPNEWIIRGVATLEMLMEYQDDNEVKSPNARHFKTAFVGIDKVIPFKNLEDLKKILC